MKTTLTCIGCPIGCEVSVYQDADHNIQKIEGYSCKKGEIYARNEVTHPTRIVTTTVMVEKGELPVVSVKTAQAVPKDKIFECIQDLKGIFVKAPVKEGQIILKDVAHTGINIVSTKNIQKQ